MKAGTKVILIGPNTVGTIEGFIRSERKIIVRFPQKTGDALVTLREGQVKEA